MLMEQVEIKNEFETIAPALWLPTNGNELLAGCIHEKSVGENMYLYPGIWMRDWDDDPVTIGPTTTPRRYHIEGMYGLEWFDHETKRPVSRCGFQLLGDYLNITHTPQGKKPENMTRDERQRLMKSGFRYHLLQKVIKIASSVGAHYVIGKHSSLHHKVVSGEITPEQGYKSIDWVYQQEYEEGRFQIDDVGNYFLRIR
jgi:hypothetical protein